METRQKMKEFLDESDISLTAVAGLIGSNHSSLGKYLNRTNSYISEPDMNARCEYFLATDGRRLAEIQHALRNGAKNRTELHRQRADILKKAKVQTAAKALVPSDSINQ